MLANSADLTLTGRTEQFQDGCRQQHCADFTSAADDGRGALAARTAIDSLGAFAWLQSDSDLFNLISIKFSFNLFFKHYI